VSASLDHVFYWKNEKDKEVDFVIGLEDKFLPIEVKCSDTVKREDKEGLYDFLKAPRAHDCGIITSVNQLKARREYTVVPLSILLLLT
jgi:predicted AAA+ superfamily ATPase